VRWIAVSLVLAITGPAVAFGEDSRLTKDEIKSLIFHARVFGTNTAEAGHECLSRMASRDNASGPCNKFAAQADYAKDLYFQMKSALAADPYQNAWLIDPEGISAAEHHYHWIRQTEDTLIGMGLYGQQRY
jgi:hypothetical protein